MQPENRLYIHWVMKMGLTVALAALVASGCGSGNLSTSKSTTVTETAAASTTARAVDPTDREYHDAAELGADLTAHGVQCDVEPTGQTVMSSFGRCTLPVDGDPSGVAIAITVWTTPAKATAGILAVTNAARVHSDITGKAHYYLIGANWLIDFDSQRKAPEQVRGAFGGNIQKVG
ncbi:hypothetical protein FZI85_25160 [Mycobacterium sp. CBMA293]|uniref:hypothetical protein n=1 Tax=unclassified Mycolicibacterium TaxID=2636767 RepID=UPI0012DE2835|nr:MULTISPECIES: hypothetical protein [unclassified Mycolicibacterium]MUL47607.1 hypothetical protein [Mycolicibacterium sp. CBMA 360]MUL61875.1 hypothetical protein [Mycolicibacterium sp. CBMA 335]MUL68948.1 hypothetical protein [Mycolicibacterium sp. CBMA 311]MUL92835.1 hypothetical protein [Mycolicibacterium sp. CBMA 230]MUM08723.1 hypothetical protein [Mycolicibacterium sp. CBMA 213]